MPSLSFDKADSLVLVKRIIDNFRVLGYRVQYTALLGKELVFGVDYRVISLVIDYEGKRHIVFASKQEIWEYLKFFLVNEKINFKEEQGGIVVLGVESDKTLDRIERNDFSGNLRRKLIKNRSKYNFNLISSDCLNNKKKIPRIIKLIKEDFSFFLNVFLCTLHIIKGQSKESKEKIFKVLVPSIIKILILNTSSNGKYYKDARLLSCLFGLLEFLLSYHDKRIDDINLLKFWVPGNSSLSVGNFLEYSSISQFSSDVLKVIFRKDEGELMKAIEIYEDRQRSIRQFINDISTSLSEEFNSYSSGLFYRMSFSMFCSFSLMMILDSEKKIYGLIFPLIIFMIVELRKVTPSIKVNSYFHKDMIWESVENSEDLLFGDSNCLSRERKIQSPPNQSFVPEISNPENVREASESELKISSEQYDFSKNDRCDRSNIADLTDAINRESQRKIKRFRNPVSLETSMKKEKSRKGSSINENNQCLQSLNEKKIYEFKNDNGDCFFMIFQHPSLSSDSKNKLFILWFPQNIDHWKVLGAENLKAYYNIILFQRWFHLHCLKKVDRKCVSSVPRSVPEGVRYKVKISTKDSRVYLCEMKKDNLPKGLPDDVRNVIEDQRSLVYEPFFVCHGHRGR